MRTVLGRLGLMPMAKSLSSEEGHRILARDRYTCRYCGLETLCRVYEKINVLAEEEFEEW